MMRKFATRIMNKITGKTLMANAILRSQCGENFVDTAIKILMAVVIGGLVLAGLYAVFGETVLPTLKERIQEMFNYAG